MIVEFGHFALVIALFAALVQAGGGLVGAAQGKRSLMALAAPAAEAQLLCTALAFAALMHAYIASDFSVGVVAENSSALKPLLYKISGTWGNHEGSLLLWITVMALFGAAVAVFGRHLPMSLKARVLGVQGLLGIGFLAFILLTSNPFARIFPPPIDGRGLNPLLQDPGLAFHPPMLYIGYVGFSLTFSFAVAGLLEGRIDAAWARWVRPWTLGAWICLTLGIALGSWWAYYELGWGGWWFWDPVENASLMPWLLGTALLHSAIVVEKRDALKRWTILLAILTFALSLIGTFLVRSGVLTSVHAFAVDPARGTFVLALMILTVGGALILYAIRAEALEPGGLFQPISREGALVLNNLLLATATATVLLGTLYPLLLDALGGGTVSVGPPYFHATFVPLMSALVIAMAVGPLLAWKRADLLAAFGRLKFAALLAVLAGVATVFLAGPAAPGQTSGPWLAPLGIGFAVWAILGAGVELWERSRRFKNLARLPRAEWGMVIAHAGIGVSILGMTGSLWQSEAIRLVRPGDKFPIAGYELTLDSVAPARGPNFAADRAHLTLTKDGHVVAELSPEKRKFTTPPMVTTETAIHTNGLADLYVALGEEDPANPGAWSLRVYHNPLAPWIWGGAVVMALGGLVSLTDRRLRIGLSHRTRRAPAPAGIAAGD